MMLEKLEEEIFEATIHFNKEILNHFKGIVSPIVAGGCIRDYFLKNKKGHLYRWSFCFYFIGILRYFFLFLSSKCSIA
jgi:hypothetical protein